MGHFADERRLKRWWDVFLDAGVSLLPLWLVVACFVYIGVASLFGFNRHAHPSTPPPLIQLSDVDSPASR